MSVSRPSGWSSRHPAPPPAESEVITLATTSGVTLAVELREPRGARGTAILLHSAMASRRIWKASGNGGFAGVLAEHGVRTLALDFRGHGDSGICASRGGRWSFDDLVREDLPALCRAVRERWPRDRLTLVGHSLGGLVAIAAVATGLGDADAIVALATNVWLPGEEPNDFLRARKAAMVGVMRALTRARGYFPARAFRVGSDDEAEPYVEGWARNWDRDEWMNDDLGVDYRAAMATLRVPILALASVGDRVLCTPQAAFRFIGRASRANVRFELIRRSDDDGHDPPDHMAMVTTRGAVSSWHDTANFCLG
jgi:predicted alpha/beta hydrolase